MQEQGPYSDVVVFGHSAQTNRLFKTRMGESPNLEKLQRLVDIEALDIFTLFEKEDVLECFCKNELRLMSGKPPEGKPYPFSLQGKKLALCITWDSCLCRLLAGGLQIPVVSQVIATQESERIPMGLHSHSERVFSLSLLGISNYVEQGGRPEKAVYFPHHYVEGGGEGYIEEVAALNGKEVSYDLVVGCVGRFLPVKNVDAAIDAMEEICKRHNVLFVLKGSYDPMWDVRQAEGYSSYLRQKIAKVYREPWFLWDWRSTPQQEMGRVYSSFDLRLNLTGGDIASTTGVEQLGHGVPCVMLEGGSNTYLFKGAARFVKNRGVSAMRHANKLYHMPVQSDLVEAIEELIVDAKARHALGKKGQEAAKKRFSPKLAKHKLSLLIHGAKPEVLLEELYKDFIRHKLEIPPWLC